MASFCPHCGEKLGEKSKYCTNCGNFISVVGNSDYTVDTKMSQSQPSRLDQLKEQLNNGQDANNNNIPSIAVVDNEPKTESKLDSKKEGLTDKSDDFTYNESQPYNSLQNDSNDRVENDTYIDVISYEHTNVKSEVKNEDMHDNIFDMSQNSSVKSKKTSYIKTDEISDAEFIQKLDVNYLSGKLASNRNKQLPVTIIIIAIMLIAFIAIGASFNGLPIIIIFAVITFSIIIKSVTSINKDKTRIIGLITVKDYSALNNLIIQKYYKTYDVKLLNSLLLINFYKLKNYDYCKSLINDYIRIKGGYLMLADSVAIATKLGIALKR